MYAQLKSVFCLCVILKPRSKEPYSLIFMELSFLSRLHCSSSTLFLFIPLAGPNLVHYYLGIFGIISSQQVHFAISPVHFLLLFYVVFVFLGLLPTSLSIFEQLPHSQLRLLTFPGSLSLVMFSLCLFCNTIFLSNDSVCFFSAEIIVLLNWIEAYRTGKRNHCSQEHIGK